MASRLVQVYMFHYSSMQTDQPANLDFFSPISKISVWSTSPKAHNLTAGYVDSASALNKINSILPAYGASNLEQALAAPSGKVLVFTDLQSSNKITDPQINLVDFGIKKEMFLKNDIHIHVPEGATPKDGPSAGAALCNTIVSAFTGIPVSKDVAMTGEITLRGMVTPIGGLKEKLLAAVRGGIKTVLIPEKNVKDLEEIPDVIKNALKIIAVSKVDEVLKHALTQSLKPLTELEIEVDNQILEAQFRSPLQPSSSQTLVTH